MCEAQTVTMGAIDVLLTAIGILMAFVAESICLCPVQPKCSCTSQNDSYICCSQFSNSVPRFSSSNVTFRRLSVRNRLISSIEDGAFRNLNISELSIIDVNITAYDCDDFAGLEQKLERLSIDSTSLRSVPKCAISRLTVLTSLQLTTSKITRVRSGDFELFTRLKFLDLRRNDIKTIERGGFRGLGELETLYLGYNNITRLDDLTFQGLLMLNRLSVQNNSIVSLPLRVLDTLRELNILDLDNNALEELPEHIFDRTVHLTSLYVNNNRLSALPEMIFSKTTKLRTLHLTGNMLTCVPRTTFVDTPDMESIAFSDNQITQFNFDTISGLRNLTYLNLSSIGYRSGNDHGALYEAFIKTLWRNFPSIFKLELRNNGITSLPQMAFSRMTKLSSLDLSYNKIDEIPEGFLQGSFRISFLNLQHNGITKLHPTVFTALGPSLYLLDLSGNPLPSTTGLALIQHLPKLTGLRHLLLSDTPLPHLSTNVTEFFGQLYQLHLRNCSLSETTDIRSILQAGRTDLSQNSLKTFGTLSNPVHINLSDMTLNISENALTEINIKFCAKRYNTISLHAADNYVKRVLLTGNGTTTVRFEVLNLAQNRLSEPVQTSGFQWCYTLDLSQNRFSSVTQFPLVDINPGSPRTCETFQMKTLNFSRNSISDISPNACLGKVITLDLSHNLLTTLPWLVPPTEYRGITLQNLFLVGNKLHFLSADILGGPTSPIHIIDIRSNQLLQIDSLEEVIRSDTVTRVYLSGNPLNCDCVSAWMRHDKVTEKFDMARCESPQEARLFFFQCFPMEDCPLVRTRVSTKTEELCEKDVAVEVGNLTSRVDNEKTVIRWTTIGHGKFRGFRLTYQDEKGLSNKTELLIHPGRHSAILDDPLDIRTYNVCLYVEMQQESLSNPVCIPVTGMKPGTSLSTGAEYYSQQVVIALASALAVCGVVLVVLLLYMIIQRFCERKSLKTESPRQEESPTETPDYEPNVKRAHTYINDHYSYIK